MDNKYSYTAAGSIPLKLVRHSTLERFRITKKIEPVHVQLCPTNKCNLRCEFCSCKNVDKDKELSFSKLTRIAANLKKLGTKAVTITGGGEPLMHDSISQIISLFNDLDIQVGLVTNGFLLDQLNQDAMSRLTWCRISCSDEIDFKGYLYEPMEEYKNVDFAFSYVVTEFFKPENLAAFIDYANKKNFSHVRVVSDLIDLDNVPSMEVVKNVKSVVDDRKVIYQERREYTKGSKRCYISLLKPLVAADGKVYPCCGVQYASMYNGGDLSFPERMSMGDASSFESLKSALFEPFDGSDCDKCYYEGYNEILAAIDGDIKHGEFL